MMPIPAVIALHVGMGALWALATLATAITGRIGRPWPAVLLGAAALNMLAGIDLWHVLHAGPWGRSEHLLVVGSFCAMIALGMQVAILFAASRDGRLDGRGLAVHRLTLGLILAAAGAMLASRLA